MQSPDTEQLPYVTSSVKRFLLDPQGNADGLILSNGLLVCFAPYLSAAVQAALHSGDRVTVYGMVPGARAMIAAAVIETESGERIVDLGPPASAAGQATIAS
jgi:hypothetical protein